MKKSAFVFTGVLFLHACVTGHFAQNEKGADKVRTEYYVGTVRTSSADGTREFAPPYESVAKRVILPEQSKIEEWVFYEGALNRTTLTLQKGRSQFKALDDLRTFTGTITYVGDPWSWSKWTYKLKMSDKSGVIEGNGSKNSKGFTTQKYFIAGGEKRVLISETYREVNKKEYEAKCKEILQ